MNRNLTMDMFVFDLKDDGNLYVSGDVDGFTAKTFIVDEEGNLWFDDEAAWTGIYYVLQSDGFYKLHEEVSNV